MSIYNTGCIKYIIIKFEAIGGKERFAWNHDHLFPLVRVMSCDVTRESEMVILDFEDYLNTNNFE